MVKEGRRQEEGEEVREGEGEEESLEERKGRLMMFESFQKTDVDAMLSELPDTWTVVQISVSQRSQLCFYAYDSSLFITMISD